MATPVTFRIPDFGRILAVFKDGGENPHYESAYSESRAWIAQYWKGIYGPKMQAFMDSGKIERLCMYAYPYASKERARALMDLHNISWLYDEVTDLQSGQEAKETAIVFRRSLTDPTFDDGSWLCRMLKDFRQTKLEGKMSPAFIVRFLESFCRYADYVGDEALYRQMDHVLDIPGYIELRREAGAVRTALDGAEYCRELELPQYVYDDPVFTIAYHAAMDLIWMVNDVHSYNMEQGKGHGAANLVTVVMKARDLSLQEAIDYIGGMTEATTLQLVDARKSLAARADPVFSRDAVQIIDGGIQFCVGEIRWDFDSERFFGKKNAEVKRTRLVKLRAPFEEHVVLNE